MNASRVFRRFGIAFALAGVVVVTHAGCGSTRPPFDANADDGGPSDGSVTEAGMGTPGFGTQQEAGPAQVVEGGIFSEGGPDVDGSSCVPDAGGPGPVTRVCLAATNNECDGAHDFAGFPTNGTSGNGFDDDCDGLVDEGCQCGAGGTTKDCYLVPASQTQGGLPVGWCAQNSKGTVDCVKQGEFPPTWSGQCRGAQPPYADDLCALGDFDCDGKDENSKSHDCNCKVGQVQCPSAPLLTAPYPPKTALPLKVDAAAWFTNPGDVSMASNWKWTMSGGDCDNILPNPTFSMYPTSNGSGSGVGTKSATLGPSGKEHGIVAQAPQLTSSFYPAFSLSGDYLLQGEFDLAGEHFVCQQKIQVRAPGIRAETCWDTVPNGIDLDLHMARVDGFSGCSKKGWSDECADEDCYYENCVNGGSLWGYGASPNTACQGWGSQTTGACRNPRLDQDANGGAATCTGSVTSPNANEFCGPENINVDAPADGSQYAVAVKYFAGTQASKTHVNVYCNGARILSTGYNPVTGNDFPVLQKAGGDATGDMWKVALVTAHVSGTTLTCDVAPVPSTTAHASTDGTTANCVDNTSTDTSSCTKYLTSSGGTPANAAALCFH